MTTGAGLDMELGGVGLLEPYRTLCDTLPRQKKRGTPHQDHPPPEPTITSLKLASHNIQKKAPLTFIAYHLEAGVHLLALQEVHCTPEVIQTTLNRTHPGSKVWGNSGGGKNGVVIVANKSVAPFIAELKEEGLDTPPAVEGCIFGVRVSLPFEERFNVFSIYSSGQPEYRSKIGPAIEPWVNTKSIFLGDMNHVQAPGIDCRNQSAPSKWRWLSEKLDGKGRNLPPGHF